LLFYSSIQETSQVALKRLFSRRLAIRSEPIFEVPDLVLDLGLFDGNCNRRVLIDRVDPVVLTKNVQATRYSLIETARRDFDGMFRTVRVETRYPASSKCHSGILTLRFSFAKA
jgi:hypothetical protein